MNFSNINVVTLHSNRLSETVQMRGHNMYSLRNEKNHLGVFRLTPSYLEGVVGWCDGPG